MAGFWEEKCVMVTGGGGFLGSHVVEQLTELGPAELIVPRRREFDLTREADVRRLFNSYEVDCVFHLAGYVGGLGANAEYPVDFFYRNILINTFTLEYAWRNGVKKVVATGAGCGYPEFADVPLKESDFWKGYPQDASAPYSLAKRMLHVQSLAYWRQYQFPILVLLPGNIYGPYDNFDYEAAHVGPALVRKFVEAVDDDLDSVTVWGTGKPSRDFVYAGDVAAGLIEAAKRCDEPVLLNLSSGTETSIRELVSVLAEITGFSGEVVWDTSRVEGQARRVFDVSKAKEVLGFSAPTSLREGFEKTVAWYRANRDDARNVHDLS